MKLNYDAVRRDAKKLRALADDCEAAAKTCSNYQSELGQYWQGASADSYLAGLAQLQQKNKNLARSIEQLSAQITAVADELEEEDRRLAAQIAAKRAAVIASTVKATVKTVVSAGAVLSGTTSATTPKTNTSTLLESASDLLSRLFGKR